MPAGSVVSEMQEKYEQMVNKYEVERKKTEQDVSDLENILREVRTNPNGNQFVI